MFLVKNISQMCDITLVSDDNNMDRHDIGSAYMLRVPVCTVLTRYISFYHNYRVERCCESLHRVDPYPPTAICFIGCLIY